MKLGKTPQYLKYALGEIFLVVIGILIALSINNWNLKRKDQEKEQKILGQLKEEYTSNLEQLEEKILMHSGIIQASLKTLSYIDNPNKVNRDSLINYLGTLGTDPTFDPIKNDLFSSGNIRLIKNERLKQLLASWSSDVQQLQEAELIWQKIIIEQFLPLGTKMGIARDISDQMWSKSKTPIYILDKDVNSTLQIGKSKNSVSVLEILKNREIEGIVSVAITYNQVSNLNAAALKARILEIIDLIDTQIH